VKTLLFPLLASSFLLAEATFITPEEYGAMLYKNPRGVGCHHCHGERGEGKVISTFKERGRDQSLFGPPIRGATIEQIERALNNRSMLMPRYMLSGSEIESLARYLADDGRP